MECAKENSGGVVEKCETEVDKRRRAAQKANLRRGPSQKSPHYQFKNGIKKSVIYHNYLGNLAPKSSLLFRALCDSAEHCYTHAV